MIRDVTADGRHMVEEVSAQYDFQGIRPTGSDPSYLSYAMLTIPEGTSFKEHYMKGDDLLVELCIFHPK